MPTKYILVGILILGSVIIGLLDANNLFILP